MDSAIFLSSSSCIFTVYFVMFWVFWTTLKLMFCRFLRLLSVKISGFFGCYSTPGLPNEYTEFIATDDSPWPKHEPEFN